VLRGLVLSERSTLEDLRDHVIDLNFEGVKKAARKVIIEEISPMKAITEGFVAGLNIVGEKFEKKEYFLSELVVAAEVVKEGMSIIEPHLQTENRGVKGQVILATVKGDNHDIGKNLVSTLLQISGFEVIDLGVDVPSEKIIEAVNRLRPQILGLSALLTITMPEMQGIIRMLKDAGLRDKVKIIVGGSPVTEEFAEKIGADYKAIDAVDGVNKCIEWTSRGS
jgi:corrinoid protein of di/trimethylamine methyltransferase